LPTITIYHFFIFIFQPLSGKKVDEAGYVLGTAAAAASTSTTPAAATPAAPAAEDEKPGTKRTRAKAAADESKKSKTEDAAAAAASTTAAPPAEEEKKVKVIVKGRAPVDPNSGLQAKAHVYENGDDIYDVMLNQVNIGHNNNKFYVIQLLEADGGGQYWTWNRWGRVGERGQSALKPCGGSLDSAKRDFLKKFQDKTKNNWANRKNFTPVHGKYTLLEMDYGTDEVEKKKAETKTDPSAPAKPKRACTLKSEVQDLIKAIFDMKMMERVMAEMEYDVKKNPLGKLKKDQVMKGYKVLQQIDNELKGSANRSVLEMLSSQFYTLIPHSYPRHIVPPVIRDQEMLKKKLAMVEALAEIEIAVSITNDTADDSEIDQLDANYKKLNSEIEPVPKDSDEFKNIQKYVNNSHPRNTPTIKTIYKLNRKGEDARFEPSKALGNRMLLWHGSRMTNFVGILSQGLRIAPPEAPVSGYRFGKGIYFADLAQLSSCYCRAYGQSDFLMLLCDVALGKTADVEHDTYMEKAPKGTNSTKALGTIEPDPKDRTTTPEGAVIPYGPIVDSKYKNVSCHEHQYIVYDVAQAKQQYLIHFNS